MTVRGLRWPQSFATVYQSAVPVEIVESLYIDAELLAGSPNYWLSRVSVMLVAEHTRYRTLPVPSDT